MISSTNFVLLWKIETLILLKRKWMILSITFDNPYFLDSPSIFFIYTIFLLSYNIRAIMIICVFFFFIFIYPWKLSYTLRYFYFFYFTIQMIRICKFILYHLSFFFFALLLYLFFFLPEIVRIVFFKGRKWNIGKFIVFYLF